MRAEVGFFEWTDLERDRAMGIEPESTLLGFTARPIGTEGGDHFQVEVCTPLALSELIGRDGAVIGRHYLFVSSIQVDLIEEFVRDRLRRLDGDDWTDLAAKVARIGHWEFEDYTEARSR